MAENQLKDLVLQLYSLLGDELAVIPKTSLLNLYVVPGKPLPPTEGLRCVVERVPTQASRENTKVVGGTFFSDLYKVSLVNFIKDKNDPEAAEKMRSAIRKVENAFTINRSLYKSPDDDTYEMCQLFVYLPCIEFS